MVKVPFNTVFDTNEDGRLELKTKIMVEGVTVTATNDDRIVFSDNSLNIGGINFSLFKGNDLEVVTSRDTTVIKGIFL